MSAIQTKLVAEYAKSNRSSCKNCGKSIASGSLRLGLSFKDPRGFDNVKWHHFACFSSKDRVAVGADRIMGFSSLKESDQEKLRKLEIDVSFDQKAKEDLIDMPGTDGIERSAKKAKFQGDDGIEMNLDKSLQEVKQSCDIIKNRLVISFADSDINKMYKDATLPHNWKSFRTVIYREKEEALFDSERIAGFDFDGCLANTSVKRVGADAWSLMYKTIPAKLKEFYDDGYKLVIFTNEMNIERWTKKRQQAVDSKIGRLDNFIKLVNLPIQVFIACGLAKNKDQTEDIFRKPKPGMWWLMEQHFNSGIAIDMDKSFYVGDAAGRAEDHSDADIKFAEAIGLKFHLPEDIFAA